MTTKPNPRPATRDPQTPEPPISPWALADALQDLPPQTLEVLRRMGFEPHPDWPVLHGLNPYEDLEIPDDDPSLTEPLLGLTSPTWRPPALHEAEREPGTPDSQPISHGANPWQERATPDDQPADPEPREIDNAAPSQPAEISDQLPSNRESRIVNPESHRPNPPISTATERERSFHDDTARPEPPLPSISEWDPEPVTEPHPTEPRAEASVGHPTSTSHPGEPRQTEPRAEASVGHPTSTSHSDEPHQTEPRAEASVGYPTSTSYPGALLAGPDRAGEPRPTEPRAEASVGYPTSTSYPGVPLAEPELGTRNSKVVPEVVPPQTIFESADNFEVVEKNDAPTANPDPQPPGSPTHHAVSRNSELGTRNFRPCAATASAGQPCRARPRLRRPFCIFHDPDFQEQRLEYAARGGRRIQQILKSPSHLFIDLSGRAAVQALLDAVIRMELLGEIPLSRSSHILRAISLAVRNFEKPVLYKDGLYRSIHDDESYSSQRDYLSRRLEDISRALTQDHAATRAQSISDASARVYEIGKVKQLYTNTPTA